MGFFFAGWGIQRSGAGRRKHIGFIVIKYSKTVLSSQDASQGSGGTSDGLHLPRGNKRFKPHLQRRFLVYDIRPPTPSNPLGLPLWIELYYYLYIATQTCIREVLILSIQILHSWLKTIPLLLNSNNFPAPASPQQTSDC